MVRCLNRAGGWGLATFNDTRDLADKVAKAAASASLVGRGDPVELAEIPASRQHISVALDRDFRGVSLADKKRLLEEYNEVLLGSDRHIVDSTAAYADSFERVTFASSEGTLVSEARPMITVYLVAVAREGDNVQTARASISGQRGYDSVLGREDPALQAGQRAAALLKAEVVAGGRYPVIVDPQLAGVFIHEAFGHLSEADFVYENRRAQEMMVLGRRFGPESLTVFDDGSAAGLRGTHQYDDEGTPTGRTDLIRDGLLVGRLHSRETARRMAEEPTGNARATGYRYPPIVRMTNTAIAVGSVAFDEMLSDVKLGLYACDAFGGQTELENFSFSSGYAFMIRNGKIAEMVKDVILAGNVFTTLKSIDAIGNDFVWSHSGG